MSNKEGAIGEIINEIYGIVAELSISSDKIVQEQGNRLRKLLEQLKYKMASDSQVRD